MPRPLATAPLPDLFRGMNKTETLRAQQLETMKRAGLIADWWYERWTFKLADDCRYTPDFIVQELSGEIRAEETKGHWRDDARAKVKMFAELYPIPIRALVKSKTGWDIETFR